MSEYCCFFLDDEDRVSGAESLLDHRDDGEAVDLAVCLLAERPYHHAVEVWDGSRLISRHVRRRPAA